MEREKEKGLWGINMRKERLLVSSYTGEKTGPFTYLYFFFLTQPIRQPTWGVGEMGRWEIGKWILQKFWKLQTSRWYMCLRTHTNIVHAYTWAPPSWLKELLKDSEGDGYVENPEPPGQHQSGFGEVKLSAKEKVSPKENNSVQMLRRVEIITVHLETGSASELAAQKDTGRPDLFLRGHVQAWFYHEPPLPKHRHLSVYDSWFFGGGLYFLNKYP